MTDDIFEFRGKHSFLSNFYMSPVVYMYNTYPSVEHAFQAAKTLNRSERKAIRDAPAPHLAKRLGRRVQLRPDWEDVKVGIMRRLIVRKFAKGSLLAERLVATDPALLIEGNTWGDTFWGADIRTGAGNNTLGIILMERREQLRENEQ